MRQSAFKIAMLGELNSLYGLAFAMTLCSDRASELSSLSFENVLNQVRGYQCIESSPRVLLFGSLYQALCGERSEGIKDIHSKITPLETPEDLNAVHCWKVDWELYADQLKPALESLPIGLRFVLYLWAVEGVPSHEIADVLGISSSEVCAMLERARERLCQLLTLESPTEILLSAPAIGYSSYGETINQVR